jgi:hypothetical protein
VHTPTYSGAPLYDEFIVSFVVCSCTDQTHEDNVNKGKTLVGTFPENLQKLQ